MIEADDHRAQLRSCIAHTSGGSSAAPRTLGLGDGGYATPTHAMSVSTVDEVNALRQCMRASLSACTSSLQHHDSLTRAVRHT